MAPSAKLTRNQNECQSIAGPETKRGTKNRAAAEDGIVSNTPWARWLDEQIAKRSLTIVGAANLSRAKVSRLRGVLYRGETPSNALAKILVTAFGKPDFTNHGSNSI